MGLKEARETDRTAVNEEAPSSNSQPSRGEFRGAGLAQPRVAVVTETVAPLRRGDCRGGRISVAATRRIAERADQGRIDENGEPCIVALRLLSRRKRECSDEALLESVRVIGLSPGASGRIARAVKRADLSGSRVAPGGALGVCSPPCRAALIVLGRRHHNHGKLPSPARPVPAATAAPDTARRTGTGVVG